MQTTIAIQEKSTPLLFARHLIGLCIAALANPLIYYSDNPARTWLETWLHPIAIALVAFGLYALFLTKRAKQAWPKSFFILAWVLLALLVASPWINTPRSNQSTPQVQQPAPGPANAKQGTSSEDKEWWKKDSTPLN